MVPNPARHAAGAFDARHHRLARELGLGLLARGEVEAGPADSNQQNITRLQLDLLRGERRLEVLKRNRFRLRVVEGLADAIVVAPDVGQNPLSRDTAARQVVDSQSRATPTGYFAIRDAVVGTQHRMLDVAQSIPL